MTFRQIIAQFSPVDCKNKLNDLLAMVERNFGVFSPDMELDIRAIISKDEIIDYFDRIIHEAHPMLEHDQVQPSPKSQKPKGSKLTEEEITARKLEKKRRKKLRNWLKRILYHLSLWIRMITEKRKIQSALFIYPKLTRCFKNSLKTEETIQNQHWNRK